VALALRMAREHGTLAILNPAPADPAALALCGLADVVTPNEHELELLTGRSFGEDEARLREAMEALLGHGAKAVVVTLGERGCAALWEGRFIRVPAYAVAVVDTTGAGDTFSGALATALAEGMGIDAALRFASAAASICVTRPSAEGAAPTRDEIAAFIARAAA
jgi:ribokinase